MISFFLLLLYTSKQQNIIDTIFFSQTKMTLKMKMGLTLKSNLGSTDTSFRESYQVLYEPFHVIIFQKLLVSLCCSRAYVCAF